MAVLDVSSGRSSSVSCRQGCLSKWRCAWFLALQYRTAQEIKAKCSLMRPPICVFHTQSLAYITPAHGSADYFAEHSVWEWPCRYNIKWFSNIKGKLWLVLTVSSLQSSVFDFDCMNDRSKMNIKWDWPSLRSADQQCSETHVAHLRRHTAC